jgi:hypothetical protein
LFACALALTGLAQSEPARYTVDVGSGLAELSVEACFDGGLPARLEARDARAADALREPRLRVAGAQWPIEPRGTSLPTGHAGSPGCVDYHVSLSGLADASWRRGGWRTHEAVLVEPDRWLWYPGGARAPGAFELRFELPPGFDVSAPWERLGAEPIFRVRDRFPGWQARMAIGRFGVEPIELAGGHLRVAILPGDPAPRRDELRQWIVSGAEALTAAYGHLPVPDVQVLVVPVGRGGEPVPWGEVRRGGGDAVHLYVDQRRPPEEFMDDWVLVHELAHLLHPAIVSRDRWLSEGIASYYQNVLRARSGLMSAQWAWEELHAGFERGVRGTPRGRTLAQVSETMMRDHSFMRVYWSGAAIALLADVELRRRSGATQSLDTALAALRDCCLPSDRSWSAREVMRRLDDLTGESVFMELYREHVGSDAFPDLGALYAALGIEPLSRTEIRLDPDAPQAAICEAIMAAPTL